MSIKIKSNETEKKLQSSETNYSIFFQSLFDDPNSKANALLLLNVSAASAKLACIQERKKEEKFASTCNSQNHLLRISKYSSKS